eukprot:776866_1
MVQSHITNCCFNITSGISISTCNTGIITQTQWTNNMNTNPITQCNAYINYKPYIIIGGYGSEGVSFKQFDPFDSSLSNINGPTTTGGNDPETFAINTVNSRIYTASGAGIASITYDINNAFTLGNIQTYSINTNAPTYISSDSSNTYVYSASYGWTTDYSSGFQVFKIDSLTGDFTSTTPIIEHRFLATPISHSHCILPNPNNPNHFYLADLGRDMIEHYEIIDNGNGSYSEILRSSVVFPSGYGPRTLAFNPIIDGILYVSLETEYKVSMISININTYYLENIQQTFSTLPNTIEYNGIVSAVGHVDTDNDGKYLYVANRDNARADIKANNIAIFQLNITNGYIINNSLIINDCGGNIPRQFKIDPSNNYMFIANQFGDGESGWPGTQGTLAMYQIDHNNNGQLIEMNIIDYNGLGYNAIGLSWIEFVIDTQIHEIPAQIIKHPSDNSNVCNDQNDVLTDKYKVSTCDISASVNTTTTTNAPSCGKNVKFTMQSSSQKWWLAFFVDDLCCGTVTKVEVKDDNLYTSFVISAFENGYWSFNNDGRSFTADITVRVTNSNNEIITFTNVLKSVDGNNNDIYYGDTNFCAGSMTTPAPNSNPTTPSPTNIGDCTSTATRKISNLGNSNEIYLCVPPDFTITQYASDNDGLYKPRIMDHIIYQNSLIVYVGSVKPWSATPETEPGTVVRAMIDIDMDGNNVYVFDVFNMSKEEFNVVTIDPITDYVYVISQENMYRCNNLHEYALDLALNNGMNIGDGGCELFIAFPGHSVELTHARHYAEFSLPNYKDLCVAFGADCDNCIYFS